MTASMFRRLCRGDKSLIGNRDFAKEIALALEEASSITSLVQRGLASIPFPISSPSHAMAR